LLFSERYTDHIEVGNGKCIDNICGEIPEQVKVSLVSVMEHFAEPVSVYPNRYDSYEVRTTVLNIAVDKFSKIRGNTHINFNHSIFNGPRHNPLSIAFTPFLFDVIELQYFELSDGEKKDFQNEINLVFKTHDIPWLLIEGRMLKIDAKQFECDVKLKTLEKIYELKDSDHKFQSAYSELMHAIEFLDKGDYKEAIANAGKSYESILKVICGLDRGNADKLTNEYIKSSMINIPATMSETGFREKVMMSLPYIRNNSGSDHGSGALDTKVTESLARLAVNIASALDTYLIEEYTNSQFKSEA